MAKNFLYLTFFTFFVITDNLSAMPGSLLGKRPRIEDPTEESPCTKASSSSSSSSSSLTLTDGLLPHNHLTYLPFDAIAKILTYIPSNNELYCKTLEDIRLQNISTLTLNSLIPEKEALQLLRKRPNLTNLDLSSNDNCNILIEALTDGCFDKLKALNLSRSNATSTHIEEILRLRPELKELILDGEKDCKNGIMQALEAGNGLKLEKLHFPFIGLSAELKQILTQCKYLKNLYLGSFSHTSKIIAEVLTELGSSMLEVLNLRYLSMKEEEIEAILKYGNRLTDLNLAYCNYHNDVPLASTIVNALKAGYANQLQKLNLQSTDTTEDDIFEIFHHCKNLTDLNLYGCYGIAQGIARTVNLEEKCPLQKLNLRDTHATPDDIYAIFDHYRDITDLDLENCNSAANGIIMALKKNNHNNLQRLSLKGTNATAFEIYHILANCPNLKELNVDNCDNSVDGIIQILNNFPYCQLQKLSLENTNATAEQIDQIITQCSMLTDVNTTKCNDSLQGVITALQKGYGAQLKRIHLLHIPFTYEQIEILQTLIQTRSTLIFIGTPL